MANNKLVLSQPLPSDHTDQPASPCDIGVINLTLGSWSGLCGFVVRYVGYDSNTVSSVYGVIFERETKNSALSPALRTIL